MLDKVEKESTEEIDYFLGKLITYCRKSRHLGNSGITFYHLYFTLLVYHILTHVSSNSLNTNNFIYILTTEKWENT